MSDPYKFSLKEMLRWCEPDGYIRGHGPDEMKRAIAAALKAGQAIRDSLGICTYVTKDGGKSYRQAEVGDSKLAVEFIEAWDAATKEDV